MKAKKGMVSVNLWESLVGETTRNISVGSNGAEFEATIKKTLSFSEFLEFVESVVSVVVDPQTGEYHPEAEDFAIRQNLVRLYTNFTLSTSVEKQYFLLYNTEVCDLILETISEAQWNALRSSITGRILHELKKMENALTMETKGIMDNISEFTKQCDSLFGDMTGDDIAGMLNGIQRISDMSDAEVATAVLERQESEKGETIVQEKASPSDAEIVFAKE